MNNAKIILNYLCSASLYNKVKNYLIFIDIYYADIAKNLPICYNNKKENNVTAKVSIKITSCLCEVI